MRTGPGTPVSNQATFREAVEVRDNDTDELVDLTDHVIHVEIADQITPPWGSGSTRLRATTEDDSIAIVGLGVFEFVFPAGNMRSLEAGNYDFGATLTFDEETAQLLIGSLAVKDGIVRAA